MNFNPTPNTTRMRKQGEKLLTIFSQTLSQLQSLPNDPELANYAAFLHGQIYGLAIALHFLFPGPGNLGEKAALMLRPVLTEHRCECKDQKGSN
ncbi:hypothetical protein [Desulfofundulus thermocisternus]|uniref:hypothetical protein n=1 Tax=Desulfofundulus thermocisternus TaxID=42471 RepID=UPI00217EE645|nr:hypothetical protein [Desulfofundulus thermocisternus]MCS5695851.1 hypothetical protein [Desulfofundulus thermocisternus]